MERWEAGPPVLVGERVLWLGSGSGIPKAGCVRWMGKLPEMGPSWTVGIELDQALPYGGIDGWWGGRHLFSCLPRHGLLVPVCTLVRESDFYPQQRRSSASAGVSAPSPWYDSAARLQHSNTVPCGYQDSAQHPKPAARRKNTSSFVQSLPLVEEETRQAVYDTRDHVHQQLQQEEQEEQQTPSAPPRARPSVRLTRSGDYSAYQWYDAVSEQAVQAVRSSSVEAFLQDDAQAPQQGSEQVDGQPSTSASSSVRRRAAGSGSSSRDRKTNSGLFSFFRWFKKGKDTDDSSDVGDSDEELRYEGARESLRDGPPSRSRASSCGSIDTVFSTDTVRSFAFVSPNSYSLGAVSPVQRRGLVTQDTDSYRSRIRQRDRRREAERNISLRRKYRLYGSDSTIRVSPDSIRDLVQDGAENQRVAAAPTPDLVVPSLGRKKRRAPTPPINPYSDYSLPTTLEHRREDVNSISECATLQIHRCHRRAVSDGSTERRIQAHVRGKRRAPTPPATAPQDAQQGTSSGTGTGTSTTGKKKRLAPQPPALVRSLSEEPSTSSRTEPTETERLKEEKEKARIEAERQRREREELDNTLEKERLERKRLEEKLETERLEKERVEQERVEKYVLEKELFEKERSEKQRLERERLRNKRREQEIIEIRDRLEVREEKEAVEQRRIDREREFLRGENSRIDRGELRRECERYDSSKQDNIDKAKQVKERADDQHSKGVKRATLEGLEVTAVESEARKLAEQNAVTHRLERDTQERIKLENERLNREIQRGERKAGLSCEEKEKLLSNICKLQAHAAGPTAPMGRDKENIAPGRSGAGGSSSPAAPLSPVSPRPWYKRSSAHRDSGGFKDIFKSLEKKHKEKEEDWMPESGVPRTTHHPTESVSSRFNIFARLTEDRKAEKRRSQVFMLANISELDREAAEIVQEQHAREAALQAAADAKFYATPDGQGDEEAEPPNGVEVPRKNSAKELISLFNSIGQVSKVTVNPSVFPKENAGEKRSWFMKERSKSSDDDRLTSSARAGTSVSSPYLSRKHIPATASEAVRASPANSKDDETAVGTRHNGASIIPKEDTTNPLRATSPSSEASSSCKVTAPLISKTSPAFAANKEISAAPSTSSSTAVAQAVPLVNGHSAGPVQGAMRFPVWVCPRCTLENPRWRFTCDACSMWRPAERKERAAPADAENDATHPPTFITENSKVQEKALEKASAKGVINWEEELKRYFPASSSSAGKAEPNKNDASVKAQNLASAGTSNNTPQQENGPVVTPLVAGTLQLSAVINGSAAPGQSSHADSLTQQVVTPKQVTPSTFIGGRLAQDEVKRKLTKSKSEDLSGQTLGGKAPELDSDKPDVEEVRKARLAFFRNSACLDLADDEMNAIALSPSYAQESSSQTTIGNKAPAAHISDEHDQWKLRKMLKEMKDSLPKRLKDKNKIKSSAHSNENSETREESHKKLASAEERLLADAGIRSVGGGGERKAEALFITKEIIHEEIRVVKPTKVSSSAQTSSSVVRRVDPSVVKPSSSSSGGKASRVLPVLVEEHSARVQDGVLYTSLRKSTRRIGTGTFELIRARDFAGIEATKTGRDGGPPPVYMNVPAEAGNHPLSPSARQHAVSPPPRGLPAAQPTRAPAPADYSPERKSSSSSSYTNSKDFVTPSSPSTSHTSGSSMRSYSVATSNHIVEQGAVQSDSPFSIGERKYAPPAPTASSSASSSSSRLASASATTASSATSSKSGQSSRQSERSALSRSASSEVPSSAGQLSRAGSVESRTASSEAGSSSGTSAAARSLSVMSDCSEVDRLTAQLSAPEGIADFRAALDKAPTQDVNTLAVNRLLRRLESTIASGQHLEAARLARDLARLKISCSVTRQRRQPSQPNPDFITVDMYVEDKVSHQGPIPLQVRPSMTVGELRAKVAKEFELPDRVQRWILGKQLAVEDTRTLLDHNITESGCPIFLYLVAPDQDSESESSSSGSTKQQQQKASAAVATIPPKSRLPPRPPPSDPNRKGVWYYIYEEDRYSFCEDSESDLSDDEPLPPPRENEQRKQQEGGTPSTTVSVEVVKVVSPVPAPRRSHLAGANVVPVASSDAAAPVAVSSAMSSAAGAVQSAVPSTSRGHAPVQPQTSGYRNQPLSPAARRRVGPAAPPAAAAVNGTAIAAVNGTAIAAVNGTSNAAVNGAVVAPVARSKPGPVPSLSSGAQGGVPAPANSSPEEGWRCPQCTLLNPLARPGCAACASDRPQGIQVLPGEAEDEGQKHYQLLVNLDRQELVPSMERFECPVCLTAFGPGDGVVLRECLHTFCRTCLLHTVKFSEEAEVRCPYRDSQYACDGVLQEREIKALVPKAMFEQHLAKSMTQAENKIGNAFHCKTPDCPGWCIFEDNVNEFRCPVCSATNCLTCQAIHAGANCAEYQARVQAEAETNEDARRTQAMLQDMVARGEAMSCPSCQVVLMKKWGCDWLRCSMCKTEICWVTRKPRWGPGGKGDVSGGCQCGVNGIKCHPKCNYCH